MEIKEMALLLKFGTATAVSTKSGMRATPLITSLILHKTNNTV
jgi:hypothetical protein